MFTFIASVYSVCFFLFLCVFLLLQGVVVGLSSTSPLIYKLQQLPSRSPAANHLIKQTYTDPLLQSPFKNKKNFLNTEKFLSVY